MFGSGLAGLPGRVHHRGVSSMNSVARFLRSVYWWNSATIGHPVRTRFLRRSAREDFPLDALWSALDTGKIPVAVAR